LAQDDASVKCWGNNFAGQLGLGRTSFREHPDGECAARSEFTVSAADRGRVLLSSQPRCRSFRISFCLTSSLCRLSPNRLCVQRGGFDLLPGCENLRWHVSHLCDPGKTQTSSEEKPLSDDLLRKSRDPSTNPTVKLQFGFLLRGRCSFRRC